MADSDNESSDSSPPLKAQYDEWIKEPLVAEKLDVYLLHWDKSTQSAPDVLDTTIFKPKDPSTIFRQAMDCVIHYHDTTLTRLQFEAEYGMPPRTRDNEVMRLRQAIVTQYLTELEMEEKKKKALHDNEEWEREVLSVVPTALRSPKMNPTERLKYITSLWPTNMPNFPDADDSLKYYGFQVGIYMEKEDDSGENEESKDDVDDSDESLPPTNPTLTAKEENWVQCDKCQKWRKLPDSVDLSELPATWYCRMNKWSRKYNKCSAAEEVTVVPSLKDTDAKTIRERKFAHQFAQRLKRMEKAFAELKYADMKEDNGVRLYVTCVECGKKRPLLGGMDLRKIPQPFVCWMNRWDEIHASCSAPQGALLDRVTSHAETSTSTSEKKAIKAKKKEKTNNATIKATKRKAEDPPPPPPPLYSSSDDEKIKKKRKEDRPTKKK
ncbi:unnamed protein product [Aphanomyces euteiches]